MSKCVQVRCDICKTEVLHGFDGGVYFSLSIKEKPLGPPYQEEKTMIEGDVCLECVEKIKAMFLGSLKSSRREGK